ncbi:MAG: SPASM domain-containing protein [Acutalibacteraceae bacterium]|nr:SPASM domain-containing protein [Acutalibacteraceae bacterium]
MWKKPRRFTLSAENFQQLCRTAARLNKKGKVFCGRGLQFIPCRNKLIYHCSAGENLLIVLANGDVMPCRRIPLVIGNVRESDLLTLHQNAPVMQALRAAGIPQGCRSCTYADLCRGGSKCLAYAKTGRFDIPDPDCPLAVP